MKTKTLKALPKRRSFMDGLRKLRAGEIIQKGDLVKYATDDGSKRSHYFKSGAATDKVRPESVGSYFRRVKQ